MKEAIKTWSTPVINEESLQIPCAVCANSKFKKYLVCEGFSYVRCTKCGLVQMNPQPKESRVLKRYNESSGNDYLAYERANEESFLQLQLLALHDAGFYNFEQRLFSACRDMPSVLDIGCATGTLLFELKKRGWKTCGVEISPAAEYARTERSMDVRSLPLLQNNFSQESFDVILASHLIEHLNKPDEFVHETYRLLKKGGCLFITTPNISGFQAKIFRGAWRSAIFDHLYLFSVETIKQLLEKAGFQIECIRTWGGLAAGSSPAWLKKIADRAVKPLGLGDVMIVRAVKQ